MKAPEKITVSIFSTILKIRIVKLDFRKPIKTNFGNQRHGNRRQAPSLSIVNGKKKKIFIGIKRDRRCATSNANSREIKGDV